MCFILGYSRHSERRVTMKQDRPTLLEDFTWDVFKKRIIQYEIAPEKIEDQIAQEILIKFYDLCHIDDMKNPQYAKSIKNVCNHKRNS